MTGRRSETARGGVELGGDGPGRSGGTLRLSGAGQGGRAAPRGCWEPGGGGRHRVEVGEPVKGDWAVRCGGRATSGPGRQLGHEQAEAAVKTGVAVARGR
jgi:hypothetical protein